jgi:glycosyltransferase 2 family protein
MNEQPTDHARPSSLPIADEPPDAGAQAGSFPVDDPRRGHAPLWRRLLPWTSGLLTLLALFLVVLHFGTIEQFTRLAWAARPDWFLLACVAQAATYVCAALVWRQALRRAGHARSLGTLVPLGLAKLFTDQVVPSSGVSGAILVARGLARRQVPTHVVTAALLVGLVSYFAAYLASALIGLAILWGNGRANTALFVVTAIFTAIVVAIPASVLWMKWRGHRLAAGWVGRSPGAARLIKAIAEAPTDLLRDPLLLIETVLLEFAIFALDALTLWLAFHALGASPAPWIAFVSFIMASMAATLGPIPLGLGTFEAACVGMLTLLGIAIETALAATLLLRGLTFWLPMVPGLWLARREIAAE